MIDSTVESKLNKLQMQYLRSLDSKNMEGWLSCFSENQEASYQCISAENIEGDLSLSFMLDDSSSRLKDRVIYINDIWKGTFQDYRTRHFTQCLDVKPVKGLENRFEMITSFHILYTPDDTRSTEVLVSGIYEDIIEISENKTVFLHKKAILDTTVLPRYLVYPV